MRWRSRTPLPPDEASLAQSRSIGPEMDEDIQPPVPPGKGDLTDSPALFVCHVLDVSIHHHDVEDALGNSTAIRKLQGRLAEVTRRRIIQFPHRRAPVKGQVVTDQDRLRRPGDLGLAIARSRLLK